MSTDERSDHVCTRRASDARVGCAASERRSRPCSTRRTTGSPARLAERLGRRASGADVLRRARCSPMSRSRPLSIAARPARDGRRPQHHGDRAADERFVGFLARHRSDGLDGRIAGRLDHGGRSRAPDRRGRAALVAAALRQWRVVGVLRLRARARVGVVPHDDARRPPAAPEVHRLEQLPVDASYPSGHTAASIAVYCGIALLVTSRIRDGRGSESRSGRSRSRSRSSSRSRACTAACTIRSTASAASSSASPALAALVRLLRGPPGSRGPRDG